MFKSKGMSGKHLTGTVIYGYLWDEKREHWLVDEEAAEVVRRIFSLTLEGYGPYQIACKLSADRIEIPVVHLARFNEGVNRSKPVKDPHGWGSSTIVNILKKREYLRSVDLARHMEVSKPSVCHAVATLRDGGFLMMDEDHFLHLTDVGREVAEKIYERHCFFTEQLIAAGVDPRTAEADACRIEHIISDESFSRLKEAAEQEQT